MLFSDTDINSRLMEGWERVISHKGIPYYVNHEAERTQWDHPILQKTLEELVDLNKIKYAAYRTASKLQLLQKRFHLDYLDLHVISAVFDKHGCGLHTDLTIQVKELEVIVREVCGRVKRGTPSLNLILDTNLMADLLLNLLINMFDPHRSGLVRCNGCKLALASLCNARLGEKYKFYFRVLSENRTMIFREKFSHFLSDMLALPALVKESRAFRTKNLESTVDKCFQSVAHGVCLHEGALYEWLYQEPQSLVWLHTMHRMNTAQTVEHPVKCAICRVRPLVGFRYKCLQCFKYNLCQNCFYTAQTSKRHKTSHPIQEYCLNATSKEDTKAFMKMIRNNIMKHRKGSSRRQGTRPDPGGHGTRQSGSPTVDLSWDDYAPNVGDENYSADDRRSRDPEADDDVISYLGLDPRHSRIIYPDDEDHVPRYIVKTEVSEPSCASGDDQPRSTSSLRSAASSGSVGAAAYNDPMNYHLDVDDGLTLPANKVKQLYTIIHKLEDENRVLSSELEELQENHSECSQSDSREQIHQLKLREEIYQARHDILESHNKRLMDQIHRLKGLVEAQMEPCARQPFRLLQPSQNAQSDPTHLMSTPKYAQSVRAWRTPTFASPVFRDALMTVNCDLSEAASVDGASVDGAPDDDDDLEYVVNKLQEAEEDEEDDEDDEDEDEGPYEGGYDFMNDDVTETPLDDSVMTGITEVVSKLKLHHLT